MAEEVLRSWSVSRDVNALRVDRRELLDPIERRATPTLDLLRGNAPALGRRWRLIERFGLPRPDPHACHEEDEGTSEFIADHVVLELGPARRAPFDETLAEALRVAVTACQAAHDASALADKVRQLLIDAQTTGGR